MKLLKCFFSVMGILAFTNEYLLFALMPWIYWPHITKLYSDSVVLLLVADPQHLGERYTANGILGYLERWDSDRFIEKTFNIAFHYVNPDIVIFLGDILDEGEVADNEEFMRYVGRFSKVFQLANFTTAIVIPGDNDIGGEHGTPSFEAAKKFTDHFGSNNYVHYKFLEFVKVNFMTQSNEFQSLVKPSHNVYRIILSHMPLISTYTNFAQRVLLHVQPHLIFSGHEHSVKHLIVTRKSRIRLHSTFHPSQTEMNFVNLSDSEIHEFIMPSCSYRMGTDKMGYGVALISTSGEMAYTILWLPSRFQQLYIYLLVMMVFILLIIVTFWCGRHMRIILRKCHFSIPRTAYV